MTALEVVIRRKLYPARAGAPSHLAIADLAFTVAAGEFVCVLGPSGCGKTTLLNMIAGLDRDYDGHITLAPDAPDHLAYVFQSPRLLPWRTARQNVEVAVDEPRAGAARAADLLALVGLEEFADAFPGQLSLGMQRRVALARAFARSPSFLLMDEPFVSLDEAGAGRLRALLVEVLAARPATVLFVTHDRREAVTLADRILVLSAAPASLAGEIAVTLDGAARFDRERVEAFCRAQQLDAATDPGRDDLDK